MKFKTWLPVFPGFYNTPYQFDIETALEDIENGKNPNIDIDYEDIVVDHQKYETAVAKSFCKVIEKALSPFVEKIKFEKVVHPRQFITNSSIHVITTLKIRPLKNYFNDRQVRKNFDQYLNRTYIQQDSKISYSNILEDWLIIIAEIKNTSRIEHKLGSILQFIFQNEFPKIKDYEIYNEVMENKIFYIDYCTIKPNALITQKLDDHKQPPL